MSQPIMQQANCMLQAIRQSVVINAIQNGMNMIRHEGHTCESTRWFYLFIVRVMC